MLSQWERTFPGRKVSLIHGNATNESEFGQDNTRVEIKGARCKTERGPQMFTGVQGFFTVPTILKLHFKLDSPVPYLSSCNI